MQIGEKYSVQGRQDLGIVTLVDLDGDVAYVELKNGVEMDFSKGLLIAPTAEIQYESVITSTWMDMYIGKEVLRQVGIYHENAVMRAIPGSTPWSALSNLHKLNHIAALIRNVAPMPVANGKDLYNKLNNGILTTRTVTECLVLQVADLAGLLNAKKVAAALRQHA